MAIFKNYHCFKILIHHSLLMVIKMEHTGHPETTNTTECNQNRLNKCKVIQCRNVNGDNLCKLFPDRLLLIDFICVGCSKQYCLSLDD